MDRSVKVVFMGTPDFAVPSLDALLKASFVEVPLVITQPDKPAGRGKRLTPPSVKVFAEMNGIPVIQPKNIKGNEELFQLIRKISPDFIVVAAYGKILPEEILEIPLVAPLNVHASLLPKYRGASPIQSVLLNGEKETGVTIMRVREKLDSGEMYLWDSTPIYLDDNAQTLHDKLADMGGKLIVKAIKGILSGDLKPIPQNDDEATYCTQIKKIDGFINWSDSSDRIFNKIRAFTPWPSVFTYFNGKLLKILKGISFEGEGGFPGEIVDISDNFTVSTAKGFLKVLEVKPEGKKKMSGSDFVRGYRVKTGDKLGGKNA